LNRLNGGQYRKEVEPSRNGVVRILTTKGRPETANAMVDTLQFGRHDRDQSAMLELEEGLLKDTKATR
jgi:hypothetical protein